jgi:RNA polymerase sigma-70 factor (ECF subfamily)
MDYSIKSEAELITSWKDGDEDGFRELYSRYQVRVFSFIIKMCKDRELASDLTQDTFMAAVNSIEQFSEGRSFLSWLFGIAHKKSIDYFRHVKVVQTHRDKEDRVVGTGEKLPDETLSNKRFREKLSVALDTLSAEQKEVFLMREMGGTSFKDIALISGCSLNTALGRMRLALKNIRVQLEQRGEYGLQ